jgi:putative phosphonate catabolism associated alcohol dehydrogenase
MASSEPAAGPDFVAARYARWDGVGEPFTVVGTTTPALPGPGEVLVRVDLATVCGSDLHTVSGRRPSPVPGVLGHEFVGTVVATGGELLCADGTPITEGLRVVWSITASCGACDRCTAGLTQKCRRLRKYGHEPLDPDRPFTGGFASHCVLMPGTTVVAVPDGMPDEVAAPAACATATVAAVLAAAGPGLSGARVLVTGLGMLGLTAVAMAAAGGAEVTAMDPDPGRREWATRFGAASTVADTAADIAAGGERPDGMDVAVELSGAPAAVDTCVRSLDVGGTAVLAGSVLPGPEVPIDPERVVRRLLTIVGVHNYRPADLLAAVDFLAAHHHTLPFAELVAGRYPLAEVGAAFAAAGSGSALRQAVVPGA